MHHVKNLAKRAGHRVQKTVGYRLLRTKKWGVDWLDDCLRIASEGWHPQFRSLEVVFDVGANIGQTARKLHLRACPRTIYSFEPVASTFEQLRSNTENLRSVKCLPYGLSDNDQEAQINIYTASVLASTCDRSPILSSDCEAFERTETIQLRTVDSVCREFEIDSIDLLKVDTEGADLRTLQGASEMLASHRIGFVLFEFYCPTSPITENGTYCPVDAFLSSQGYRLISFYTDFVHEQQSIGVYNALYMATPEVLV
ncbi:FkbM family methyltransferase [Novipirellula artificiosorum]|uniref:Methyltransferase FkbM domain-containing protein n=1 Tax=Novipirellula artificiosorum TaxID=2528016 RepID=A0A5C6DCL2_9BACT|nr:FkbM family methyltransferase [Novipirellula artificiosorum]TWU34418.1 hypothetical protein Poly41_45660 [Novipirellula artificiosorum]